MKGYLILLALFAMTIATPAEANLENSIQDYVEIVKCFLDQSALVDDVVSAVEIIKSGDYSQLLTFAFKAYADVQAAINKCIPVTLGSYGLTQDFKAGCTECAKTFLNIREPTKDDVIVLSECMEAAGCRLPIQIDILRIIKMMEEMAKGKKY